MLADLQNAYIQAVERAGDSTVNVSTAQRPYGPPWGSWPRRGFGSGVVLDDQGNILTTHHVVDGAEKVIVTFTDGRGLSGSVVGGDEETDIAVVRADGHVRRRELPPAPSGPRSRRRRAGHPDGCRGEPGEQRRAPRGPARARGRDQHRDDPLRGRHRLRDPDQRRPLGGPRDPRARTRPAGVARHRRVRRRPTPRGL